MSRAARKMLIRSIGSDDSRSIWRILLVNNSQVLTSLSQPEIDQLVADRRQFHQHPELAYNEARTAQVIAERLRSNGCEVKTAVGRTGVLGLLSATKSVANSLRRSQ